MGIGLLSIFIYRNWRHRSAIPYIQIYTEESDNVENNVPQKNSTRADPIRIGIGAMVSPKRTFLYYQELLEYISEVLGEPVRMVQRRTYSEVNNLLERGELEAALICSGAYVELKDRGKIELLVAPVVGGDTFYYSYLIVHRNSTLKTLEDLKDMSFAFSDPLSNTGHLYPLYLIIEKGYSPHNFFSKTIFTYSHDNSIQAVGRGIADGASVDSLIWDYFEKTMPDFVSRTKVIHRSLPFGIPPVVVPVGLDRALKEKLERCLLTIHEKEKGKNILKKLMIEKFVKVDDSLYDSIRRMREVVLR